MKAVIAEPAVSESELVRQNEICQRFGISRDTWLLWRKSGRTPAPVDLPGHPRWLRADIDEFARRLTRVGRNYFGSHRRSA